MNEASIEERAHAWNLENGYEGDIAEHRETQLFFIKPTKGELKKAIRQAKKGDRIYVTK